MDFYNSTEAKQYARNKTRIIKEINDIEENIASAVDDNQFECDVYNTVMTDAREIAEPSKDAKVHCIMELSKVMLHHEEDEEPSEKKNYFRVGEVLAVKDRNDTNPLEFKVSEINDNGDIINLEITQRGEFTSNIFERADLEYKDMTNWLDIDSDFGLISDLKITRDGEITVKDLTEGDETQTNWFPIKKTYTLNDLPQMSFGVLNDLYIRNINEIYVKTNNGWEESNQLYDYVTFKLPLDYCDEGTVIYNVFGKNWVKTHCGWYVVPKIYDLGDSATPNVKDYRSYDIVYYNEVIRDEEGEIIRRIPHRIYKCCHNVWMNILYELDWKEKPTDDFGNDLDLFIYPEGNMRVKADGHWNIAENEWRFDMIHLEDSFGEVHDVITYTGKYEPETTYVKLEKSAEYPQGHWVQVIKVWNLNDYLLGRLPVDVDLFWRIKNIIIDEVGDGYMYPTSVVFNSGEASAIVKIINDKIVQIQLLNGGDEYIEIPEINFVMNAPVLSKKYYQVWKQMTVNNVLQDEMLQVMEYFETNKKYAITRITNEKTGNTFYWHIQWN